MIYTPIAAFVIAACLAMAIIPLAKKFAAKAGLVDLPDQKRKLHKNATPLIGGICVFVATLVAIALTAILFQSELQQIQLNIQLLLGLLIASAAILLLGVLDDRFNIRGRQKLLGQIVVATILILFGYRFDSISVYGHTLDLQIFSIIVVYAWILIGVNSVNLLDGADGFATTIGLLMSIALCVMSFHIQKYDDAVICAAMAGALLAFMRFNFPPASAYLGDAGSMLIGLFIAAMSIKSASKEAATYAFLAPIALLAIPMFDTLAAIVRRRLTGRSIYAVDRGHLHHALMGKGFGPRKALLLFFSMCLMTATGGTMSLIYREAEYAILSIMAVIVFLFVGRVFGVAEYKLLTNRSKSVFRSFFTMPNPENTSHHATVQLQGERDWESCWEVLRQFAENRRLHKMTLDLNLPWIHESFNANYTNGERGRQSDEIWAIHLPLKLGERIIGRLDLEGGLFDSDDFEFVVQDLNSIRTDLEHFFELTVGLPTTENDGSKAEIQSIEFSNAEKQAQVG